MLEGTGRWYDFTTSCNFMCPFEDKPLKLADHCAGNALRQVSKYLMLNCTSKAILIMNPNTRLPVPGARKRGGVKNHLIKTQNIFKKTLKTKKSKKPLKVNIGAWKKTVNNERKPWTTLLNNMKSFDIKILGVAQTHWNDTVEDAFEHKGYVIIHSARIDRIKR